MQLLFILFAVVAGMTSTLQSGSNAMLQKTLHAPLWAAAIVSVITLLASLAAALVAGERLPSVGEMANVPWLAWAGGLFGLCFVLATIYASPRLGAGLFIALIVTASTVISLALDHFGLMGFAVRQAHLGRIVGALLMIAGVALIAAF
jgi:transporter family-2 protein